VHARQKRQTFSLPTPRRSGEVPLRTVDLGVRYGTHSVLKAVTFGCRRGERLVVVGRNGAGKSSLLRCLAGVQEPTTGGVELGANVAIGYFAQEHEQVDMGVSVLDNIDDTVLTTETERRALLGSFGIGGAAAQQMPSTLSGGERAKLGLAMLAAGRANVLALDEPTNNLDPFSIEAVGTMLSRWPGTVVVVSHDRGFVEALEPTHSLLLPDEVFTYWDEATLDLVELK
jgi:ATPase subunit of ABC transporter with duplicated ATPase domains